MFEENTINDMQLREIPLTTDKNLPLSTYIEEMDTDELRLDHPLQRYALQWDKAKKSNLVRRIIQGGEFLPLLICTQFDKNGCEVSWLIDGKQRLTSLKEFVDGEYAIHPKTRDYMVTYDGILYETKSNKTGKFGLKRNRNGEYIPVLDENGRRQRVRQTIDIRGLKFSELPPELKNKVKKYMVPAQVKHKCTDEDIKLEILDYNSGSPMNVAQIGKSSLGDKLATTIKELSEHRFILDKCGFSMQNKIKGVTERSIGEALSLVSFGIEGWVKNYSELCLKMAGCISEDDVTFFKELLDKLDETTIRTDALEAHMKNKEFFIVIANFAYFLSKNYDLDCYGKFLQDFVSNIKYQKVINTDELDDNGEEIFDSYVSVYEKSTKNKNVIESRLNQMNEMLDDYLVKNFSEVTDEYDEFEDKDIDDECHESEVTESETGYDNEEFDAEYDNEEDEEFELTEYDPDELLEFAMEFTSDEMAIQSLMLTTDCPYADFSKKTLRDTVQWYAEYGDKSMIKDCIFYKSFSIMNGISNEDKNLPFYIYAAKCLFTGSEDIDIDEWLEDFKKTAFKEIDSDENNIPTSNSTVALKQSEVIQYILNYKKEGVKLNEAI